MLQVKELVKNKKRVLLFIGSVLIITVLVFYLLSKPVIINNSVPPVVTNVPELSLIKTTPATGNRETFDPFSQTFFEFSSDLDTATVNVSVTPDIIISATVNKKEPRILVIEPTKVPWADGVEYTIVVKNLRGINGDELKKPVEFRFSITQPAELFGGDPN